MRCRPRYDRRGLSASRNDSYQKRKRTNFAKLALLLSTPAPTMLRGGDRVVVTATVRFLNGIFVIADVTMVFLRLSCKAKPRNCSGKDTGYERRYTGNRLGAPHLECLAHRRGAAVLRARVNQAARLPAVGSLRRRVPVARVDLGLSRTGRRGASHRRPVHEGGGF